MRVIDPVKTPGKNCKLIGGRSSPKMIGGKTSRVLGRHGERVEDMD